MVVPMVSVALTLVWIGSMTNVTAQDMNKPKDGSICVVGGGLSGLVLANKLKDAGEAVVLFEKSFDHIGGMVDTEEASNDVRWEKGPVYLSPSSALDSYIAACGLTKAKPKKGPVNVAIINSVNGSFIDLTKELLKKWQLDLPRLVQRYIGLRNLYPYQLFEPDGYDYLTYKPQTDLYRSSHSWLKDNDLEDMVILMNISMSYQGYGDLNEVPALYMLKMITPSVLSSVYQIVFAPGEDDESFFIREGLTSLAYCLAEKLEFVYMGYNLQAVGRYTLGFNPNRVILSFKTGRGARLQTVTYCKTVVLAFPPLLNKMQKMIPSLGPWEKNLLSAIRVNKFFSAGRIIRNPAARSKLFFLVNSYNNADLGDGRPMMLMRSPWNDEAFTMYSWLYGRYGSGPTETDIAWVEKYQRLVIDPFSFGQPRMSFVNGYEFFPHVESKDIKDNFFHNFTCYQGVNGVYYGTTLTSIESVIGAVEGAAMLATRILCALQKQKVCFNYEQDCTEVYLQILNTN